MNQPQSLGILINMRLLSLVAVFFLLFGVIPTNISGDSFSEKADDYQKQFVDAPPVYSYVDGKIVKKGCKVLSTQTLEPDSRIIINYDGSTGFAPDELEYIKNFIEGGGEFKVGMAKCIEMVFGKAFFGVTVNLVKTDSKDSKYDSQLQTVFLKPDACKVGDLFTKIETLAHELIHAHSDVLMKPMNCYEEGMTVAMTDLAGKLFCQFNGITGRAAEVFDGPPAGTRDYDLLNQEAAAATNGFFWTTPDLTYRRVVGASERYKLAGTVWWKIWRQTVPGNINVDDPNTYGPGTFFVDFNKEFYNTFRPWVDTGRRFVFDDDVIKLIKLQMKRVLTNDKGNSYIEGQDFDEWYESQHILNVGVNEGPKLYVNQSWQPTLAPSGGLWNACGFPQISYFYKDAQGNENLLNGKLKVEISSLAQIDYGQPLTCQSRFVFWNNGNDRPTAWQEYEIENGQIVALSKTSSTLGALDFSQILRRGCRIVLTASTFDDLYEVKRELFFPVKIGVERSSGLCYGTIDASKPGTLRCERSSFPEVKQVIPINGDGTYMVSFGPADIITFYYTTIDDLGEETTEEITVVAGTKEMIKNLTFR